MEALYIFILNYQMKHSSISYEEIHRTFVQKLLNQNKNAE